MQDEIKANEIIPAEKLAELEAVIKAAGKMLMSYWQDGKRTENVGIKTKQDGSYVTEADFKSNEMIVSALQKLFPEDSILSEEIPAKGDIHKAKRVWVVDPLDGTKSFIDGEDDFSILVGLVENGQPIAGLLYFPARELFGCAQNKLKAVVEGRELKVSTATSPRPQSIYLRHCSFEKLGELVYPNWMDSGLALLSVAQGSFDGIIIRLVQHKEWDLAAPAMFILEAGGMVTDGKGKAISFCRGPFDYEYFVASNGLVHSGLLEML